jgi:hypothetical protein
MWRVHRRLTKAKEEARDRARYWDGRMAARRCQLEQQERDARRGHISELRQAL